MENRKIIFTTHALDRLEEANITPQEAKEFIKYSTKEKRNGDHKKYKDEKYGKGKGQDICDLLESMYTAFDFAP